MSIRGLLNEEPGTFFTSEPASFDGASRGLGAANMLVKGRSGRPPLRRRTLAGKPPAAGKGSLRAPPAGL